MTYAKYDSGQLAEAENSESDAFELQSRGRVSRVVDCPICAAAAEQRPDVNLSICNQCGHIFQTDLAVTMEYDAKYAHQYDSRPVREMSLLRWNFIQRHLALPVGSHVLDVGYGNGAFLKCAREAGMKIYGIDLHSEDFGIPVVDFDTDNTYDLVCFFDSLEHFPEFSNVFKLKARAAIVSIPNTPRSLLQAPTAWRHYKPGEHLHYFSRSSLNRVMRNWGFSHKHAEGFPEDDLRGKLTLDNKTADNIYTAIYTRGEDFKA